MRYREPILAVLLMGASIYPGIRISEMSREIRISGDSTPGTLAGWLSHGFSVRKAAADKAWIDILQYCGGRSFGVDRGEKLVRMAGNATDLDPGFIYVYSFSGSMLMWQCKRPQEAVELLKKGIRNNPSEKRLKLYLAAFTYYRLNDLASQVRALEELVGMPDTPPMLYRILANVYSRQGNLRQAVKMWVFIAEHSEEWMDREWAKAKLARHGFRLMR